MLPANGQLRSYTRSSSKFPATRAVLNLSDINYMARYTPLLHRCDWKKGFSASSTAYIRQRSSTTRIEALFRALAYCEYLGPIFQSQLFNIDPDESIDTLFSNNQGGFGSRIKQNSVHEVVN